MTRTSTQDTMAPATLGASAPTTAGRTQASTRRTALGRFGEETAARWLAEQGYRVVARNWRGVDGELDLVAEHGGWWVGVEVKTRSGLGYGDPLEAITPRKLRRLHRLTRQWWNESPLTERTDRWRVDAVAVLVPPGGGVRVDLVQDVRP